MSFLRLLPLSALLLCACEKPEAKADAPDTPTEPQPTAAEIAAKEAKIEELERDIEDSTNLISDMEAFVLMERAKIEDDPGYDQSFMEEALAGQDEQRELIEEARKQIQELKGLK